MCIARNEAGRFLRWTIPALFDFCDEVRVVCDASTDGTHKILTDHGCVVKRNDRPLFFDHEGRARQQLLDWTMEGNPTHILAIDCDELVADGQQLREKMQGTSKSGVWSLDMQEVWKADEQSLSIRQDGGWKAHPVGIAFAVQDMMQNRQLRRHWVIPDRALACGRVPVAVAQAANRNRQGEPSATEILHLGWSCEKDRDERYQRYVKHDGGKFHASTHLQSIMYEDDRVELTKRDWPVALSGMKAGLLDRINR